MALRNAFSPESVIFSVRKNYIPIKPRERKESRIPADGNNGNLSIFFCRPIDSGKMGGDLSMGIKRIYHVEHFRIERCLLRQVSSASPQRRSTSILSFHASISETEMTGTFSERIFTCEGSRLVKTAASSISDYPGAAVSTPRPIFPYPKIPIFIFILFLLSSCCVYVS